MTYPWILSAPLKDTASTKFYFSSIAARFYYLGVKVFKQGKGLIGFFMLKVRDDRLSLLYSYFENAHAAAVSTAVVHHAKAMGADRLSLYDHRLVTRIGQIRGPIGPAKPPHEDSCSQNRWPKGAGLAAVCRGGTGIWHFY